MFYQKYWKIVWKNVSDAVLNALHTGKFPPALNHIHIILIPKKKFSKMISDFKLISFCNVLYKIMVKILAIRLKLILPYMISSTQSAFVPSRLITDNILIAYEVVYYLGQRRTKKSLYDYKARYK